MALIIRSTTVLSSPKYPAIDAVESLPVNNYSNRWTAESLTVSSGGKVSNLPNAVSGPIGAFTQPDAELAPVRAAENGFSHVANTGTQSLSTKSFTADTGPKTLVVVGKILAGATAALVGANGANWNIGIVNGNNFFMNAGKSIIGPPKDNLWHVFIGVFDGANSVLSVDGVEYTGDAGTNQPANLRIFSAGGGVHVTGGVRDLALYPNAMRSEERRTLTAKLMRKYNL